MHRGQERLYLQCKLYFGFIKAKVFIHNLPAVQISLSKTISLRKQYLAVGISLPKATRIPFREILTSRVINFTFDQTIVASDNCLSFACLFLFPTGTQYPAGSPEYRISDRLRSTICCKQQCYAFVRQIAQSLAMSTALDFRKCKRLLLSSLAVSALYR